MASEPGDFYGVLYGRHSISQMMQMMCLQNPGPNFSQAFNIYLDNTSHTKLLCEKHECFSASSSYAA